MPNFRRLQVIKNRYTGNVGEIGLAFNPKSRRYFELTSHEREVFLKSNGDVKKLIDSRMNKYGCIEPATLPEKETTKPLSNVSRVRIAIEQDISNARVKLPVHDFSDKSDHIVAGSSSGTDQSDGETY